MRGTFRPASRPRCSMNDKPSKSSLVRRWFRVIGPGVITGAANDDPSAVTTYSIAGAQFGTAFLWTSLFTWPLLAAAQMMCARIGMVTGRGLVGALKQKFPKPVLLIVCVALFATVLYTLGLLGVGFLVVPVLSGSAAYALAELFSWRQGLDKTPVTAKRFYATIAISTLFGILIRLAGIRPVKALLWAATVNGILAPFLLLGVVAIAGDSEIILRQQSTKAARVIVTLTSLAMLFAAAMFIF